MILGFVGIGLITVNAWGQSVTQPVQSRAHERGGTGAAAQPEPGGGGVGWGVVIELASPIELKRLVDLAAERSGVRIEYDPGVLSGNVTLRMSGGPSANAGEAGQAGWGGQRGLRADELWPVVNQLLAARGFTVVQAPDRDAAASDINKEENAAPHVASRQPLYRVVRVAEAAAGARLEPGEGAAAVASVPPAAGFASVLVRLRYASARDAAEAAKAVLSKQGSQVSTIGETGLLLLSDIAPRLQEAMRVIEQIDVAGEPVTVETYESTGLGAGKLTTLVAQVLAKRDALAGGKKPTTTTGSTTARNDSDQLDVGAGVLLGQDLRGDVLATPDNRGVLVIAPRSTQPAWRSLLETLDRREAVVTKTYVPRRFTPDQVATLIEQTVDTQGDERFKLYINKLTSALIITATEPQQGEIAGLLARLEEVPPPSAQPVRRIAVRNRSVSEVLPLLERLLATRFPDQGPASPIVSTREQREGWSSGTGGARTSENAGSNTGSSVRTGPAVDTPAAAPTVDTPPSPSVTGARDAALGRPPSDNGPRELSVGDFSTDDLTLASDEPTNTIIASGSPAALDRVAALVAELDIRQPQVMIEVLLLNISDSDSFDFGVELERLERTGGTAIKLSSLFGLSSPGGLQNAGPLGIGRAVSGTASGFTGLVLDPGEFSVVVRALETLNEGRTLTIPKVLVSNNEQAEFDSVVEQPVLSVNASDTVSTTSFGGFQQAGTTISVTPRISPADHLGLEYNLTRGAFIGESSDPGLPPPRQQTTTSSVVTIPDGFTIVVGGFEETQEGNAKDQVPFIGRVPLIGELFKNRSQSSSRSKFYVFIRATILRDDRMTALKHLSGRDMRGLDPRIDDGWPEVEPRIIR